MVRGFAAATAAMSAVLVARQGERRTIHALGGDVVDEHHGDVGRTGGRHCLRHQRRVRRLPAEVQWGSAERRTRSSTRRRSAPARQRSSRSGLRGVRGGEPGKPGGRVHSSVSPLATRAAVDQQSRDARVVEREAVRPRRRRRERAGPARRARPGGERACRIERRADEGGAQDRDRSVHRRVVRAEQPGPDPNEGVRTLAGTIGSGTTPSVPARRRPARRHRRAR